jgi:hypothetical protein
MIATIELYARVTDTMQAVAAARLKASLSGPDLFQPVVACAAV